MFYYSKIIHSQATMIWPEFQPPPPHKSYVTRVTLKVTQVIFEILKFRLRWCGATAWLFSPLQDKYLNFNPSPVLPAHVHELSQLFGVFFTHITKKKAQMIGVSPSNSMWAGSVKKTMIPWTRSNFKTLEKIRAQELRGDDLNNNDNTHFISVDLAKNSCFTNCRKYNPTNSLQIKSNQILFFFCERGKPE